MENTINILKCLFNNSIFCIDINDLVCSKYNYYVCTIYNFIQDNTRLVIFLAILIIIFLVYFITRGNSNNISETSQKDNDTEEVEEKEYKYLIDIGMSINYETDEYTLNNRQLLFISSDDEKVISIWEFIITELGVWPSSSDDLPIEITISVGNEEYYNTTREYELLWENYIKFINSDWDRIIAVGKIQIIESV